MVNRVLEYFQFVFPEPDFILVPEQSPAIGMAEARRSTWSRLAAEGAKRDFLCSKVPPLAYDDKVEVRSGPEWKNPRLVPLSDVDPMPGDPDGLANLGRLLRSEAQGIRDALTRLAGVNTEEFWEGEAAQYSKSKPTS